jgi:DNA polymerase
VLYLDLETFSELDLKTVALDRYSSHPSTRILMCAFCVDEGPMQFWQEGDDRTELIRAITSSTSVAWNVSFERAVLARVWNVRAKRWIDAMVNARYASLPAGLKDCNKVPFFAGQAVTSKETLLINKFCKPQKDGSIRDRNTDPEDWAAFCDYCKRDVYDTRLINNWVMQHFSVPERVYKSWVLDQEINKRGMPIDLPFVLNAKMEADRLQALALQQQKELTGLDNPNSPAQLLKWVQERGYVYNGLGKELVKKAITELPDGECKAALQLRLAGAKSSIKKLDKILKTIGTGSRLRDQYSFYKAHTGRWAGKGAQLQNLKAPRTKEEKIKVGEVVLALEAGREVSSLDDLSLSMRPIITAPRGKKVVLADFKSVENRALAWISGCEPMADVYRTCKHCDLFQDVCKCPEFECKDPYIDFASRMEGVDYAEVTSEMRQVAKPGTLGCGFGLGGGKLIRQARCKKCKQVWNVKLVEDKSQCPICKEFVLSNQVQKTGLWRYAEMMGIELSQDDAAKQVNEFRMSFTDVCNFWIGLENCFASTTLTRRKETITSSLGPTLTFIYKDPALRIILPSGRELIYACPYAHWGRNPQGFKVLTLGFDGVHGNAWGRQSTYGGRLCENVVQAIAADLLMDGLDRVARDPRFEIVGHTHDEGITLTDENFTDAVKVLEGYFSMVEPWAAGLLMDADGYEGRRYMKG